MSHDWISFTTDYGTDDGFVAACVGVIANIAPHARVIDVTHSVPAGDIRCGATLLAHAVPYLPRAVHIAVIDPGVGTARRGLAITAGESVLVGPDNGLLLPAAEALGGAAAAHELTEPAFWLPTVSRTFHGRDVFAPVAAHLAAGAGPDALGPALEIAGLVRLPRPRVTARPGELAAEVLVIDRFGNIALAASASDLTTAAMHAGDRVQVTAGDRANAADSAATGADTGDRAHLVASDQAAAATIGTTFADVPAGGLVVLVDSAGRVAIAVNGGSAAQRLGVSAGQLVRLALQ